LLRSAIVLKPSTILSFHRALVKRKYRLIFTPKTRGKTGPRGLDRAPPDEKIANTNRKIACLDDYRWQKRCRGLYQLPVAA
jgi:hypothetical protein